MTIAIFEPESVTQTHPALKLRFAFQAAVWRIGLGIFAVKELIYLGKLRRFPGQPLTRKVGYVLSKIPESVFVSLVAAVVVATLLELIVRYLTQPRMTGWLRPRDDGSFAMPYAFRLDATERAEAEWPARHLSGRKWMPGTLVLTDRKLWFFPHAWDAEPWSVSREVAAAAIGRESAPPMTWGFVEGLPDRVVLQTRGRRDLFAVLEPDLVLAHFDDPGLGNGR